MADIQMLLQGDGYDWLLNDVIVDQAIVDHARHLDDAECWSECFHCREGAGRRVPEVVPGPVGRLEINPDWGPESGSSQTTEEGDR